jgi:hypothetical protein
MHAPLTIQHRWYTSVLGSLRLLWPTAELPGAQHVPPGSAPHLADLPATAQSDNTAPDWQTFAGLLVRFPPSNTTHHSSLDDPCSMTQVIPGKSRCGKSARPDP